MAQSFSLSVIFKAIDQMTSPINKMVGGFKKIRQRAKNANRDLKKLNQSFITVGKGMASIGRSMALRVTAPIVGFGALSLKSAYSFQKAMNMVGAVTKTTGMPAFKQLEDQAKELGRTTSFTATQAAEAMRFLGMSGMNASEIMGALPKVLELAASAQLDLGSSADIVTNIMRGMGLETKDLAHVNDVLVNAMTAANVDLSMLGESFKYAGPIAKGAGLDIETTAALIAKMGDAGIQGSMAGTALRGMLLRLQNPAKSVSGIIKALAKDMENSKDASEQTASKGMFDLVGMIEQLEKKGATAAQIAKLVGDRAGPGLAVLVDQGTDSLKAFIEKLKEQGTAASVQQAQLRGLPGAWKLMTSAFEGFQLALADSGLSGAAESLLGSLKGMFSWLAEVNPAMLKFGMVLAGAAAVTGPLLIGLGGIITLAGMIGSALGIAATSVLAIGGLISFVVAGLASWGYTIYYLWENWNLFTREVLESLTWIWDKFKAFGLWLGESFKIILSSLLPDWALKVLGWKGVKMEKPSTAASSMGLIGGIGELSRSKADVNITIKADKGTEATVDRVNQKRGDMNVNLATVGYVGANNSWRDMM